MSTRLKSFKNGQRVKVIDAATPGGGEQSITINALGTVSRIRIRDGGAWVTLDERNQNASVHPFDASDPRGRNVLAYAGDCEAATEGRAAGNRAERRANKVEAAKAADDNAVPAPTIATFGRDHWSTFAYVETRCVDYEGVPDRRHLRCIHGRHPGQKHEGGDASQYPTRLKNNVDINNHDDWDCIDDLVREGLLESRGTSLYPRFELTPLGREVASQLREHKANRFSFDTFEPRVTP